MCFHLLRACFYRSQTIPFNHLYAGMSVFAVGMSIFLLSCPCMIKPATFEVTSECKQIEFYGNDVL